MKAKRVFLLGAGASHGARTPRPPLGTTLHQYLIRYLKAAWDELKQLEDDDGTISSSVRDELQKHLASTTSFEVLAGALQDSGNFQLLQKLNFLAACALAPPVNDDPRYDDAFIEKPDVYDRLLSHVFATCGSAKDISFITLNYDCLLERAICRYMEAVDGSAGLGCRCALVNYMLPGYGGKVEVLKPHGSINWMPDILMGDGTLTENQPVPLTMRIRHDGSQSYKRIAVVDSPKHGESEDVLIAYYAPRKWSKVNLDTLEIVRGIACERISHAQEVTVIGVKLRSDPLDDPFLSRVQVLLQAKARKFSGSVTYVSPLRDDALTAQAFDFSTQEVTFEEYVELLERSWGSSGLSKA
ncbi:hypothetical protein DNFV4_04351 [Nitrospira tepida]|uniref:SIR2-like domain-containing protein n=1 Tax=Nitrospira tepida TaxID=2973512 RepID=A0AA86N3D4_9BACT|nr:hypothetical protein [Nitrospira tepida]CAI4033909.1 hypothetical protein DNFV4_04351 [Nitrospira tepida]